MISHPRFYALADIELSSTRRRDDRSCLAFRARHYSGSPAREARRWWVHDHHADGRRKEATPVYRVTGLAKVITAQEHDDTVFVQYHPKGIKGQWAQSYHCSLRSHMQVA